MAGIDERKPLADSLNHSDVISLVGGQGVLVSFLVQIASSDDRGTMDDREVILGELQPAHQQAVRFSNRTPADGALFPGGPKSHPPGDRARAAGKHSSTRNSFESVGRPV